MRSMQSAAQFPAQPSVSGLALVDGESPPAVQVAGVSASWRKLLMQAERSAPHLQVAAIEGESGAGKQTLARYLFARSPLAAAGFQRCWSATPIPPPSPASSISIALTCSPRPARGCCWAYSSRCKTVLWGAP